MTNRPIFLRSLAFVLIFLLISSIGLPVTRGGVITFSDLSAGQQLNGFRATAVYLSGEGTPIGGRFIHERTGFTLDLLQIQSVPQGFIWVNSFPSSDMGEPHTQEHLLLGKGNKGRAVASEEDMSLA